MKLPGGERAVVPPGKLETYVLSSDHERGRHKARMFAAALQLGPADVEVLRSALLTAASREEAFFQFTAPRGDIYRLDFVLQFQGRAARFQSGWRVPTEGGPPRLTTAFPIGSADDG